MSDANLSPEERLRQEIAGLPVDEILALCYSFAQKQDRLRLYLDVMRRRGGQRAQFACCLICFDLARQGDTVLQKEFVFLAGTIRELALNEGFVQELLGGDQYLTFIWELLEAQLEEMDSRFDTEHTVQTTHPTSGDDLELNALDLLSDDDFGDELEDLSFDIDEPALRQSFDEAVDRFLGKVPEIPAYHPNAGFRLGHRGDSDRIERFLLELDSLRDPVPAARAYRALTLLFYSTHMRSKSLFGSVNERKQMLLREGIREFETSGDTMWHIAGVMSMHGSPTAWRKIAEVLTDYTHWRAAYGHDDRSIELYDGVERQIDRDRKRAVAGVLAANNPPDSMDFSELDTRNYETLGVREGYEEWSGTYDDCAYRQLDIELMEAIDSVPWHDCATVADLACGTGRIGSWLLERGVHAVDGVDFTKQMLDIARAKGVYRRLEDSEMSATALDAGVYDLITNSLAVGHIEALEPLYREASRLAKPEGLFVIIAYHPHFLLIGVPTHFNRESGESVAIRNHVHLISEHVAAARANGWRLRDLRERVVDREWVEQMSNWRKHLHRPVSFLAVWERIRQGRLG